MIFVHRGCLSKWIQTTHETRRAEYDILRARLLDSIDRSLTHLKADIGERPLSFVRNDSPDPADSSVLLTRDKHLAYLPYIRTTHSN